MSNPGFGKSMMRSCLWYLLYVKQKSICLEQSAADLILKPKGNVNNHHKTYKMHI